MLSSDRNIESIAQLVEAAKRYAELQGEYVKLSVAEKSVRVLTALAVTALVAMLLLAAALFFSFALAAALEPVTGMALAYVAVAAAYVLAMLLVLAFRRRWIERPLVRFLASLLLEE